MNPPLQVVARRVEVPRAVPFRISRSAAPETALDLVEVTVTWGDHVGVGEGAPQDYYGETGDTAVRFCRELDGLLGDDPFALEQITALLAERPGNMAAKSAIDAAVHDLVGKLVGQPVWRFLGVSRSSPPTAFTISLADPDVMARDAERAARRPFRWFKLKVGGRDGDDLARVAAVRSVTPLPLSIDVNEAWSADEAIAALPRLVELGVDHVEQPLAAGDPDAARVKACSPLPIIVDEDCHTSHDITECATRGHGINIKLAKSGGIREAIRMVHAARAQGLLVMVGCMGETALGVAATCPVASLADIVDLDGNLDLVRDPWAGVTLDSDGVQRPSHLPGLGVVPA